MASRSRSSAERGLGGVIARLGAAALLAAALAGCAAMGAAEEDDLDSIADPLEFINRPIFAVNNAADTLLLRPLAVAYRDLMPSPLKTNVRNVLEWLTLPLTFIHDMLQGEFERAEEAAARFVTNALTLGLGDPASDLGHPPYHKEDAGQTVAVWGVEDGGPYLMLPLLGPSSLRDAFGTAVDFFIDPVVLGSIEVSLPRSATGAVDWRTRNMNEIDELKYTSIDYYAAVRSLYRQRRRVDIRNGEIDVLQPAPGVSIDFDLLEEDRAQAGD